MTTQRTELFSNDYLSDKELMDRYGWIIQEDDLKFETSEAMIEYLQRQYESENEFMFRDLERNLNITGDFIMIADLGLWGGCHIGYKEVRNLRDTLYNNYDITTIYYDRYDMKIDGVHHNGVNYIKIREFKDLISDEQRENFLNKLYNGTLKKGDISRYTQSVKKYLLHI